jgi:predicted metal-dependent hydrolase
MEGDLEVVVPKGFNRKLIPDILQKKHRWIKRTTKRLKERRQFLATQPLLPEQIFLCAIGQLWQVEYRPTLSTRITTTEKIEQRLILLSGPVDNVDLCKTALRRWVARQAKHHLVSWLREISKQEKLPFDKVAIRGQKTRWGSCSSRRTVSLNYKLLLLPPALARYVLIHELCHTKHLNHSPKFWVLVEKKEPNYKQAKAKLRLAWRYLPGWLQD